MEKLKNIVVKVPPNARESTLKDIERVMRGKIYTVVVEEPRRGGWIDYILEA